MDAVFRALADPTRRRLLDELFKDDGQTLSALEARLPMTRFGVMKHLRVLEEAGLVVTRRRGREKLHFLNPVPIRLVHDRWVSKYAEPSICQAVLSQGRLRLPLGITSSPQLRRQEGRTHVGQGRSTEHPAASRDREAGRCYGRRRGQRDIVARECRRRGLPGAPERQAEAPAAGTAEAGAVARRLGGRRLSGPTAVLFEGC